jgi:hypothetical protein
MSLLSDLINGKQITLSDGSKMTVSYKTDANVLSISLGSESVVLAESDIGILQRIFNLLRLSKDLESKI